MLCSHSEMPWLQHFTIGTRLTFRLLVNWCFQLLLKSVKFLVFKRLHFWLVIQRKVWVNVWVLLVVRRIFALLIFYVSLQLRLLFLNQFQNVKHIVFALYLSERRVALLSVGLEKFRFVQYRKIQIATFYIFHGPRWTEWKRKEITE